MRWQGEFIPDSYIKSLILDGDFDTAYVAVSTFITKRILKPVHKKIIKHMVYRDSTLDLAPRGFGKSTVGDVDYCITKILREPNIRIMIGSKTQGQAEAFLKEIRTHFEVNEDLKRIFGDLKGDKWTDKEFTVSARTIIKKEATLTALGASGQVVSKHFDVIIGDDLVGFENARTETQREKLKEWFYSSLEPTLEPHGEIHILGTRYHPLDLYQTFIDSGNYSVQVQKAIQDDDSSLWQRKFSIEKLKKKKAEAGSIIFNMQYQNDVELAKGTIFKPNYFRYYDNYNIGRRNKEVFVDHEGERKEVKVYFGIDLAISQKETADYFVLMVIGIDKDMNIFVLDYIKERMTFDAQLNKIIQYGNSKFPMVEGIGIESNSYQMAMAQELKRSSNLPIHKIKTVKDKVSRAMRRSALFENEKVYFRKNMKDFEEQLLLFPDVEHDDLFDGFDFAVQMSEKGSRVKIHDRKHFNI
jgi:predicted phage terminase large subunit-like protein